MARSCVSLIAGILALLAYVRTLAPTIFPLDSAELTNAALTLGLVHSPGYPLYLMLAHLFSYIPLGDAAYRINLFSAVAGAATVCLIVSLARQLSGDSWSAFAAGLSFAFCFYVWAACVVAEVYSLQGLMLATSLLSCLRWRECGSFKALGLGALMTGLAFANNPATVLWWPGLLVLSLSGLRTHHMGSKRKAVAFLILLLGMTPILYLPIRSAAQPEFVYAGHYDEHGIFRAADLACWRELWSFLSGRQFSSLMWGYSASQLPRELGNFLYRLWGAFLGTGLPLGGWGIWIIFRRQPRIATGLLLTIIPHAVFFVAYRAPDKDTMFLPVYLVWTLFIAVGLSQILVLMPRVARPAVVMLPFALLIINARYADVSDFREAGDQAISRLLSAPRHSLYLASWGNAATMRYYQITEGVREDVEVVNTFFASPEIRVLLVGNHLSAGRPVQSTFSDSALRASYRFVPDEHGFRVLPR